MIGGLKHRIGGNSKVGCVLGIDFKKIGQCHGQSFMSHDVYGHSCAIIGAVWNLDGRSFDGTDDSVEAPNNPSLNITGAITISVRVKLISSKVQNIAGKGEADTYVPYKLTVFSDETIYFLQSEGGTTWHTPINPPDTLSLDIWHYLAATNDLKTARVYLNEAGIGIDTTPATSLMTNSFPVDIGKAGTGTFFNGLISKVNICSFADYAPRILQRAIDARRN